MERSVAIVVLGKGICAQHEKQKRGEDLAVLHRKHERGLSTLLVPQVHLHPYVGWGKEYRHFSSKKSFDVYTGILIFPKRS
jgi:hypothetical protein